MARWEGVGGSVAIYRLPGGGGFLWGVATSVRAAPVISRI